MRAEARQRSHTDREGDRAGANQLEFSRVRDNFAEHVTLHERLYQPREREQ